MWVRRESICLACRFLYPAGVTCSHGRGAMRALRDPDERAGLITEVWGSMRRHVRQAGKVGVTGGGLGSVLDGCSGCGDLFDGDSLAFALIAIVVIGLVWLIARVVIDLVRARRAAGARRDVNLRPPTGQIGTVLAAPALALDPLTCEPCVAFGLVLADRGKPMLRDGATIGFDVMLDSGERVRVPPGTCQIDMTAARREDGDVERYLETVDPQRIHCRLPDPFPHTRAWLVAIHPGDRVEVLSRLAPAADASAAGSYRESASLLVPEGIVQLRGHVLV